VRYAQAQAVSYILAEEHLQKVHKLLHKSISAYNFYNIRHLEKFSSAKGARQ
jgi:hypothetical protein